MYPDNNDVSHLLNGRVAINNGETLSVTLAETDNVIAIASLRYQHDDDQTWVDYSLPLPDKADLVGVPESLTVQLARNGQVQVIKLVPLAVIQEAVERQCAVGDFISKVAPSFGFIGGAFNEPLRINVGMALRSVTFSLKASKMFLNLNRVAFVAQNGKAIDASEVASFTYSSSMGEQVSAARIMSGGGFHSKADDNPYITFTFREPTFVKRIEYTNRNDKWGLRAQTLCVNATDEHNNTLALFDLPALQNKLALYGQLQLMLGKRNIHPQQTRAQLLQQLRDYFYSAFTQDSAAELDANEVLLIPQFLSSWATNLQDDSTIDLELELLALYLVWYMQKRISLNIQCFENLLSKRKWLQQLEDHINALRTKQNADAIEITKHGTALANKLTTNPDKLVYSIKMLIDDLVQVGAKPCLAYGTLLGAVRDGKFIAHDDDVDLLVELPSEGLNIAQAMQAQLALGEKLSKDKYVVNKSSPRDDVLNLHVYIKETAALIDLFPYWYVGKEAMLHMEKMQIRGVPREIFEGRTSIDLYNETFPAPAKVTDFLQQRYGEGWHSPDKFHEWPWKLTD